MVRSPSPCWPLAAGRRGVWHPEQQRLLSGEPDGKFRRRAPQWRGSTRRRRSTSAPSSTNPASARRACPGKPEGFDVEIAKLIAKALGIPDGQDRVRRDPVEGPRGRHRTGKVDIVAATYTINDKRKQRVGVRRAVLRGRTEHHGQAKDDTSITGPDSFKDGTKKVCSVTGSTPAENIKKYVKDVASQLVLFDTYDKCRDALKGGQVDAVTTDNVILLGYIAKDQASFKMAGNNFTKEPYGIGLKKDDTAFRNFINDTLEKASPGRQLEEGLGRHRRQVRRGSRAPRRPSTATDPMDRRVT